VRPIATALVLCSALMGVIAVNGMAGERRLADFRRVVVADEALPVQRAAAEEIATYVGRIVGREIPIVPLSRYGRDEKGLSFFVGDVVARRLFELELAPWREEEWLLRSLPEGLLLAGDDEAGNPWSIRTRAGSMLATYTLLEDYLGVHWFWPGPFGEHVPVRPDAALPAIERRETPKFMIRSVQIGYGSRYHTREFSQAARRWSRRSRLGWTRSAVFGHSWYSAFHLKTGEDFKEHPEWFALVNGKRRPPQMCTTNPEVIERMVRYVLNGKQDIMNISPSDGGGFCECDRCRALDVPGLLAYDNKSPMLSDRIFTYANEVARRVRERNPKKGCGMFAYTYYNKPPVRIKKLEPNLYISFVYQCASHRNPAAYAQWKESVAGWKKLGAKLVVREGWGNHYYLDLPFLHYDQIVHNLAEAYRLGFIAAYGEGSKCFATQAPNYWAITHMMWDPEQDGEALMNEFWQSAYGPVAGEMKAFFESYNRALDRNWSKMRRLVDTHGIAYANLINSWHLLLPPDVVHEAEAHLRAAEAKVPPGRYADRVAFHRFGQDYTRMMARGRSGETTPAPAGL